MIGRWIIYEGMFNDRWVYRQIVGETPKFWVVQPIRPDGSTDDLPTRRVSKSSIGRHRIVETIDVARSIADAVTSRLKHLNETHKKNKVAILDWGIPQPPQGETE